MGSFRIMSFVGERCYTLRSILISALILLCMLQTTNAADCEKCLELAERRGKKAPRVLTGITFAEWCKKKVFAKTRKDTQDLSIRNNTVLCVWHFNSVIRNRRRLSETKRAAQ